MHTRKSLLFLFVAAAAFVLAFGSLTSLVRTGRPNDYYSHIPLIPAISAYILYRQRKKLFGGVAGSPLLGMAIVTLGLGLFIVDGLLQPGLIGHAELCASGAISFLAGSSIAIFGWQAFKDSLFPFAFLFFVVPLPIIWMEGLVSALVAGSTGFVCLLYRLVGVPFAQQGSVFYLPAFSVEIASECSGIRSSLALMISSVLAGQLFLNKSWKKVVLVMAVFPVTIFKNGIRIVTLYLLSYFVDIGIIEGGFLHKSGGFIFFGLALCILGFLLWHLRERNIAGRQANSQPGGEFPDE
jgi:exosortase